MFNKKTVCPTCKRKLSLLKENLYLVSEPQTALSAIVNVESVFEAFDCPWCGCQMRINKRYPKFEIKKEKNSNESN